mgnify:CR=1 FL=1
MNKNAISRGGILLIASTITIILLLVLSVTKISDIKKTVSEIDEVNSTLGINEGRLKNLEDLNENLDELMDDFIVLSKKIPSSPDKNKLIGLLNQYASENDVLLSQVDFDELNVEESMEESEGESENDTPNELKVKLAFTGEYASLIKLLKKLDNGERLIRIDEIEISSTGDFSKILRADITAVAFYNK